MPLPDTDHIIFYDIPGTVPGTAWSPNSWKTRFALNYKALPYRTQFVEYPDIASVLTALGVEPNPPSVAPWPYTLPAIYDPRTRTVVTESARIARYLDETYPATPALLPADSRALQAGFVQAFATELHQKLMPLMLHAIATSLSPRSAEYFFETREKSLGCKLEELSPPGSEKRAEQWVVAEKAFSVVASWFDAAGNGRLLLSGGGPGGDDGKVTHADTYVAGVLIWLRIMLDSEDWKRIESFDAGRWKRYLALFDNWADTSR